MERALPAPVAAVERQLTPEAIVRFERLYEPETVSAGDGQPTVTTVPSGRLFPPRYVFESTDGGFSYRQASEDGQFVGVGTVLELRPHGESTELRLSSSVSPTLALPLLGRDAAGRRRRTLARFCTRLAGVRRPAPSRASASRPAAEATSGPSRRRRRTHAAAGRGR